MSVRTEDEVFDQEAPAYLTMRITVSRRHKKLVMNSAPKFRLVANHEASKWLYCHFSVVGERWNLAAFITQLQLKGVSYAFTVD